MEGREAFPPVRRVNAKTLTVGFYRGIPYYKIVAVDGSKGYAWDLNKLMYPSRTEMLDAYLEEDEA